MITRALSWHNKGCVRCVEVPSQLPPWAIQRYPFRKPGIFLIRATFHKSRKGMTDGWQWFWIFSLDLEWGLFFNKTTERQWLSAHNDKDHGQNGNPRLPSVGWSCLFVTHPDPILESHGSQYQAKNNKSLSDHQVTGLETITTHHLHDSERLNPTTCFSCNLIFALH